MEQTANYSLKKPDYEDGADIVALNENADAIDAALKSSADTIAAHTTDTTAHITTAERTTWNAGITSIYTHTKSGTVHTLSGSGNNISFKATAAISAGDTWKVNSTTVTATLQNGDALPADLFKSGYWVTGVRLDGTKLNFRAGASTVPSIFGNGSDGDAVITGTITLPVPVPHQSIVEKQYKSLTINAGAILKAAAHNAGLIIRVQGDCTIHGTIDQSGLAPKTNTGNNYAYPAQLVCGNGGNGGAGSNGEHTAPGGSGGTGMLKRAYGGGYGGGAGGGAGTGSSSQANYGGGNGGNSTNTEISVNQIFVGGSPSLSVLETRHGSYGGGGAGGSTKGGAGGSGAGSNGEAATHFTSGGGGGAGNYGGGVVLLYVGGNLLIDGVIKSNGLKGGNGADGGDGSVDGNRAGAGGGAGGGGGGAIYILHNGSYTNTGLLQVNGGNGGVGGVGSTAVASNGVAGGIGSITVIQHTN